MRPEITEAEATRALRDVFGICNGQVVGTLPSYDNQNFVVRNVETAIKYVLKISNTDESREMVELQNSVQRIACERMPHLALPQCIATADNADVGSVEDAHGQSFLVRLLTFLPGVPYYQVRPQTPALFRSLGTMLGELSACLAGVALPGMHQDLEWDLCNSVRTIETHIDALHDPTQRALIVFYMERYKRDSESIFRRQRMSVVHGDANEANVLVFNDPTASLTGKPQCVSGLIDFGDAVYTHTVAEVAIACAYAMLGKRAPLSTAVEVISGFHSSFPLCEEEISILFDLMCMRLCVSATMGTFKLSLEPENEYLKLSMVPAWKTLEMLCCVSSARVHALFRDACQLEPCPLHRDIVAFLAHPERTYAPIVDVDTRQPGAVCALDFSIASPLMAELALGLAQRDATQQRHAECDPFAPVLQLELMRRGATMAIGRYNEARLVYTGGGYTGQATSEDTVNDARTVHLGIDLFRPAGTPVFAPLAATVVSVCDNATPLDYGPTVILRHTTAEFVFYSLYGHLSRSCLSSLSPGDSLVAGQQFAQIGSRSENGGWSPHVHFQLMTNLLSDDRHSVGDFPGVAVASERRVWLSLCPDPNLILGIPSVDLACHTSRCSLEHATTAELLSIRDQTLSRALSLAYTPARAPLRFVYGRGSRLFDAAGSSYLDAVNNVPHVGHSHPRVVTALRRQAAILNTNTRYLHPLLLEYSQRLLATFPTQAKFEVCFFVNSGSEANELALRLARAARPNARGIVCLEGGYHGNTSSLVDVSHYKFAGRGGSGAPPAHVEAAPLPDVYRGVHRDEATAGALYGRDVGVAAERLVERGERVAAFVAEPLIGCGGQVVPPKGYLTAAYAAAREHGALCIADEVQVGFGRVGERWWAFEAVGDDEAYPDIVVLGKPIANGHPMGAVVVTRSVADAFETGMEFFNTFGGNPVSCAAALAVLDVLEDEHLRDNATRVGALLLARLRELQTRHPLIGDVRGLGLYVGIDLVLDRTTRAPASAQAAYIARRMCDKRVLISTDGPFSNVLKIKPPMVFDEADAHTMVALLDETLSETCCCL